jgi:predicted methyltransferase
MNHAVQEFILKDNEGNPVKVKTREYNFEIEEIIINRIGQEKWDEYQKTGILEYNLVLKDVQEDFPKLLEGEGLNKIDWKKQKYDTLRAIHFFFVRYTKNARRRELELEKEMLLSNLNMLQKIIDSMQPSISEIMNLKSTNAN